MSDFTFGFIFSIVILLLFCAPFALEEIRVQRRIERNKKKRRVYQHAERCGMCNGSGEGLGKNSEFDCVACDGTGLYIYHSKYDENEIDYHRSKTRTERHEWTKLAYPTY